MSFLYTTPRRALLTVLPPRMASFDSISSKRLLGMRSGLRGEPFFTRFARRRQVWGLPLTVALQYSASLRLRLTLRVGVDWLVHGKPFQTIGKANTE